jgi:hypothetical protein
MKTFDITEAQIRQAVAEIPNLRVRDLTAWETKAGKPRVRFTVTVEDSRGRFGRVSPDGRRIKAACWHAHGMLFERMLELAPDCRILTGPSGSVTSEGGNWQDWNQGSIAAPAMASTLCHCGW